MKHVLCIAIISMWSWNVMGALPLDLFSEDTEVGTSPAAERERLLKFPFLLNGANGNNTLGVASFAALGALWGLLPLFGLACLITGLLVNHGSYGGPQLHPSGYRSRSFRTNEEDLLIRWEDLTLIDWTQAVQRLLTSPKFECQKRFLCEMALLEGGLTSIKSKINSFLRVVSFVKPLLHKIRSPLEEIEEAIQKGRHGNPASCERSFSKCSFSAVEVVLRLLSNKA